MFKTNLKAVYRRLSIAVVCCSLLVFQAWAQAPQAIRSRSTMKMENGLQRLLFAFPEGRLVVNIPDDIRPGDTISGTVSTEPAGADPSEKARNQGVLSGYVVDFGDGAKVDADQPKFTWVPRMMDAS